MLRRNLYKDKESAGSLLDKEDRTSLLVLVFGDEG